MMRATRRASLLAAFVLLNSAASANAECAWVLWMESGNPAERRSRRRGRGRSRLDDVYVRRRGWRL